MFSNVVGEHTLWKILAIELEEYEVCVSLFSCASFCCPVRIPFEAVRRSRVLSFCEIENASAAWCVGS